MRTAEVSGTAGPASGGGTVFLLDVDDTLLDNDRFAADLGARLQRDFGAAGRDRYWALFGQLRNEFGYADYLGALQLFRNGAEDDLKLLGMSGFLLEYPFAERLYSGALDVIAHLQRLGQPVVLSDGDVVFQPRKVQRSGIWDAVAGRVVIAVHKERELDVVQRLHPAERYVAIDDKPLLLAAMKRVLGAKLTTVFVRQGHYARESSRMVIDPSPDLSIDHIGELINAEPSYFQTVAPSSEGAHPPASA